MSTAPGQQYEDLASELLQGGLSPADAQARLVEQGTAPADADAALSTRVPVYLRGEVARLLAENLPVMRVQDTLIDRGFERGEVFAVVDEVLAHPVARPPAAGSAGPSAAAVVVPQVFALGRRMRDRMIWRLAIVGGVGVAFGGASIIKSDAFFTSALVLVGLGTWAWFTREPARDPQRDKLLEQLNQPIPDQTGRAGVRALKENLASFKSRGSAKDPPQGN
jgi:hypothetical protein